jgi:lipopolysaccharide transport system ATP-binding protein
MKPAIRVENLSKCYRIGTRTHPANRNLTEAITDGVRRLFRGSEHSNGEGDGTFWALKDVSFEVQPGEVVGIIGRNGAGKSTLLKILSRIVEPTSGWAEVRGRMASLLEVGTGFHPELTGRENVYMNGSILGMSKREIDRKFDEIVAFAEIEQFIDTPVKRYSSGMYVRLAFAVAAHLDAEILVVDEVLAVGDARFQQKCLGKMQSIRQSGKTILFVSHNLGTVTALCSKGIRLQSGKVVGIGTAREQASLYVNQLATKKGISLIDRTDRIGSGVARLTRVRVMDADESKEINVLFSGEGVTIRFDYMAQRPLIRPIMLMAIYDAFGNIVTFLSSEYTGDILESNQLSGSFVCRIPELPLNTGTYFLNVCLRENDVEADHIASVAQIEVQANSFFASGKSPPVSHGSLLCRYQWCVDKEAK